ncbi:MAG: hypothetical protein ACJAYB_002062 [Psychromonas sp.]|jgi:hypothetical protein
MWNYKTAQVVIERTFMPFLEEYYVMSKSAKFDRADVVEKATKLY